MTTVGIKFKAMEHTTGQWQYIKPLPSVLRRRQRRFVMALSLVALGMFLTSLFACWIAAGMMIQSDKMCWVMDACRSQMIAKYK